MAGTGSEASKVVVVAFTRRRRASFRTLIRAVRGVSVLGGGVLAACWAGQVGLSKLTLFTEMILLPLLGTAVAVAFVFPS